MLQTCAQDLVTHGHAWGIPRPPLVTLRASPQEHPPGWEAQRGGGVLRVVPAVIPTRSALSLGSWAPRDVSPLQPWVGGMCKTTMWHQARQVSSAGNSRANVGIASWLRHRLCILSHGTSSPQGLFSLHSGEYHTAAAAVRRSLSLAAGSRCASR